MAKRSLILFFTFLLAALSACKQNQPVLQAIATESTPDSAPVPTSVFTLIPALTATPTELPPTSTPPQPTATTPPASPTPPPAVASGIPLTLLSINMLDPNHGWGEAQLPDAYGWALVYTEDGGKTWETARLPGGYPTYSEYFTLDGRTIWAAQAQLDPTAISANSVSVYRSDDGGLSWRASQPLSLVTSLEALAEVFVPDVLFFLDDRTGWLVASIGHYMHQDVIMIYQTLDGGQTWNLVTDKFQAGGSGGAALPCDVSGLVFVNEQHGWLAGNCLAVSLDERWKVLETNDGGRTWQYRDLPQPSDAPADVLSEQAACASDGLTRHASGLITLDFRCVDYSAPGSTPVFLFTYTSTDSGATWKTAQVTSASFADDRFGIALGPLSQAGQRYLYVSVDGGSTWSPSFAVAWPQAQLDFVGSQMGWAVASRYNNETGITDYALVQTRDGGGLWELVQAVAR